jgi:hypothetical protein
VVVAVSEAGLGLLLAVVSEAFSPGLGLANQPWLGCQCRSRLYLQH